MAIEKYVYNSTCCLMEPKNYDNKNGNGKQRKQNGKNTHTHTDTTKNRNIKDKADGQIL